MKASAAGPPTLARAGTWLLIVPVALLVVQTVALIATQAHLYADGAFYFYSVLETGWPLDIDFSRHFAHLVTQWPLAVAIAAGVSDLGTLSRLLGVGLYVPTFVGLACCAWVARARPALLVFPLLTTVAASANAAFFIVSEGHLLSAVFWPLLFLLVLQDRWTIGTCIGAALLAFPTLRSYESMAALGPFLVVAAVWRAWRAQRVTERWWFGLLALYFCAGVAIAAYFIVYPRVPANYQSFLGALRFYRDHLGHVNVLGIVSIVGLSLCALVLLIGAPSALWGRVVLVAFGLACAVSVALPLLQPSTVAPLLQYRARVLNLYVPPVLACVFLIALARPPRERAWRLALALTAVLSLAQASWHLIAVREWAHYLKVFRNEVTTRRGLVPFPQSVLSKPSIEGRPIATMNWGWTMPTMSIMLAPSGQVRAIIDNPAGERWQPFDATNPEKLPKFSRYGVRYDEYLGSLIAQ